MTQQPLITVIVPCYNVEAYLPKCVDSILGQTYKNLEVILVDDGSPDNSGRICDEYSAKDSRVKVIHQQNAGVSAARNTGLDAACGEWITFLDSDDWFAKNAFETFLEAVREEECDRYIFNRIVVNNGIELPLSHLKPEKLVRKGKELKWFTIDMLYPFYDRLMNDVWTGGVRGVNCNLYKASTIKGHHIRFNTNLKIAEDALFNYDVISHSSSVMMKDVVIGYYRVSQESVMHRFTPAVLDINNCSIEAFYARMGSLMDNDVDYKRAFVGLVAECVFRAMRLYLVHPQNTASYKERILELKSWINGNPLIKKAIDEAEGKYLPIGKRQIMAALKREYFLIGGVISKMAIAYLKKRKAI